MEACDVFHFSNVTLLFSKALFDSYWFRHLSLPIHEVAVTCLMIASKMHEDNYLCLRDCCDLCATTTKPEIFQQHERCILQFFDFRLHIETPATLTRKWLLKHPISSLYEKEVNKKCDQLLRLCGKGIFFSCFQAQKIVETLTKIVMTKHGNISHEKLCEIFLQHLSTSSFSPFLSKNIK